MIHTLFYEELGTILYALAKADGHVEDNEIAEVEMKIRHELKRHKHFNEHPENREIILTLLSFENSTKHKLTLKAACSSFTAFLEKYGSRLDEHMKELALTLMNHVAAANHGINVAEQKIINEIKNKFVDQYHP